MTTSQSAPRRAASMPAAVVRLVPSEPTALARAEALVQSYRGLADVFHELLAEQSLDALLERIAVTVGALVPYDALHIYEADHARELLVPVHVRSEWEEQILNARSAFGEGITGWAVVNREPVWTNAAHLDPRVKIVPGTPVEPEALITVPLIARGVLKGALNIYRIGDEAAFNEDEFELAKRFGDAAALALDNTQVRALLEHQAQTDGLTGLYNHRYFHERLRTELQRASRTQLPVGLLMLDIDDFKRANDVYGHAIGDDILVQLAEVLRSTARGSDVVCRLGGEEFGVIMPLTGAAATSALADRIVQRVASEEFGPTGGLTVSVGLTEGLADASNPRELVACAEAAMMTAKARGKNQVVSFCEDANERPESPEPARAVRSIAHLQLLQRFAAKLSRITDLPEIGVTVANELRSLIDYHNCRVFVVEGEMVVPIAFRGDLSALPTTGIDVLKVPIGYGITGHVVASGESLLVRDAARCEYAEVIPGTEAIDESLLAVPLRYGARVIGAIVVSKLGFDQFDEDDLHLVQVLAAQSAFAVENARLYEAQRREAESAKALLGFARELASGTGLDDVLRRTAAQTSRIIGCDLAAVWLEDSATGELLLRAASGSEGEDAAAAAAKLDARRLLDRVRAGGEPFVLQDGLGETPSAEGDEQPYLVAPFALPDGTPGCIAAKGGVADSNPRERQLLLLDGLAQQAKLAIANASSFEGLESTFISTIEALANALEANDRYTSTHARWIADMALRVGERFGLEGDELRRLELGALLHDIGKIGIPSDLISKPGRLMPAERKLVEQHSELGERIIEPIGRLNDVRMIVRHCHERFDGKGYPDSLAGTEIPIQSRIIFVCDAFHAMTTDRPYRGRLPVAEARRRVAAEAGAQFDPRVVDAFLALLYEQDADGFAA